jgi:hypothetical protein
MKYKIEIKWALIMIVSSLLWMVLERAVGLHDVYLDKQMYLTNLFFYSDYMAVCGGSER